MRLGLPSPTEGELRLPFISFFSTSGSSWARKLCSPRSPRESKLWLEPGSPFFLFLFFCASRCSWAGELCSPPLPIEKEFWLPLFSFFSFFSVFLGAARATVANKNGASTPFFNTYGGNCVGEL